ncbi:endoglucanase/beta-glucosidase, cellulose synthase subunit [Komagataeibacter europaeus NBRC 3261]|uniref:Endoglucanase/beta-glucosidase, cellulose synthase subunit n=1 Tax=Komagataeibacter europaeus NBRC 3261 TaxID=1234669 RepID=A0A0D6Q138_KOMEU|nr:endoglucanase [Komagataeibacter europaeus]GAN96491.1 endoglucanase/beta-glucosidase, cellulose synthase subunit [Komagataeibacter europaeus NBRC 3261]
MSSADKEVAGEQANHPTVDMDNPQDVSRMLTAGYGLSGKGFHYHSFRPVVRDMPVEDPDESVHEDMHDVHAYAEDQYAEPEQHVPAAEPEPQPVAPPFVASPEVPPAPPSPPPAPSPVAPEVVLAPQPPVAETVAPPAPPPPETVVRPTPRPNPVASASDVVQSGGQERRGLPPFTEAPAAPVPPRPAPAQSAPFTVEAPEPVVTATDDWAPVPKAQQLRGQRPTGPGFFFAKAGDRTQMARLFQSPSVPTSPPVPKPVSKVTTMTKLDKNSWNNSTGRAPAPTDNSPTLTEVFMTLGGRATDRLIPKPSLREALLRKREDENGES